MSCQYRAAWCTVLGMARRTNDSSEALNRMAQGYDCPQCGAWADVECSTKSGKPHLRRVDKAVARHLKSRRG